MYVSAQTQGESRRGDRILHGGAEYLSILTKEFAWCRPSGPAQLAPYFAKIKNGWSYTSTFPYACVACTGKIYFYFIKILNSEVMLFVPVTVPSVNDIRTSTKMGWSDVYCARSKGGGIGVGGGYEPLILYSYEYFNDRKIFIIFHL
jgi:hypothetical protein